MSSFVIGISGASGAIYGIRLVQALLCHGHSLELVFSATARGITHDETGIDLGSTPATAEAAIAAYLKAEKDPKLVPTGTFRVHAERNMYATIASGSAPTDAMVVAPCSMKTLAGIAHGYADTLIGRAADVHLKEGRPLILVPRETPLSAVHLDNMAALARVPGVRMVPAMPAFYNGAENVMALVDFVVARILDQISPGIEWAPRWQGAGEGGRSNR